MNAPVSVDHLAPAVPRTIGLSDSDLLREETNAAALISVL
jgi:hypothetical protein